VTASQGTKVFFHEDDDGAVEILPVGAWVHCEQQLGRIAEHDVKHRVPGGAGWTSIYICEDSPVSMVELGLTLAELDAALSPHLPFTDEVETGYSTYREPVQRTRAWVVSGYMALYASWDESGRVRSIFCSSSFVEPAKQPSFLAAMKALGALRPLLLVDWNADALLRLDDTEMLQRWLTGEEESADEA
jgi:hypothetical protein